MSKIRSIQHKLIDQQVSIAPLAAFRILFGAVMFISVIRFAWKGWIHDLYIQPQFFFPYDGFEWVKPLGSTGMYLVFGLMALSTLGIAFGAFYRISAPAFFLSFTYVELLDKTNYLNHYYFVSIVAFLLVLLPAHMAWSLDVKRNPSIQRATVPAWTINVIKGQLTLVYFFAGLAKLHPDWLFEAMPLKLWLPANSHLPLIGPLLKYGWVAFVFAWAGALYDLSIPFLLMIRKTRPFAFVAVIIFHLMTWVLFNIGMFPFIMILSSLIFFPANFHEGWLEKFLGGMEEKFSGNWQPSKAFTTFAALIFGIHFSLQILLPMRFSLYPGELFWNEEGFRFSWRVMLMEKAGYAEFRVKDGNIGGETTVDPSEYLTRQQQKMMSTQPDMILQFAHFLENEFKSNGMNDPQVRADVFVSLNGRGSQRFVDAQRDLTLEKDRILNHRDWIIPMHTSKREELSVVE